MLARGKTIVNCTRKKTEKKAVAAFLLLEEIDLSEYRQTFFNKLAVFVFVDIEYKPKLRYIYCSIQRLQKSIKKALYEAKVSGLQLTKRTNFRLYIFSRILRLLVNFGKLNTHEIFF